MLGVGVLVVSILVSSTAVLTQPVYASQEYAYLRPAVLSLLGDHLTNPGGDGDLDLDVTVAHFVDGMHLPPAPSCSIELRLRHPRRHPRPRTF